MPLDLVARLLDHDGALVEREDATTVLALAPDDVRRELGLPEDVLLSEDGHDGTVGCGYGADLFRDVVARTLRRGAVAVGEARVAAPKPGLPAAYQGLNVALRPEKGPAGEVWTLVGLFRVDARADDRRELRVSAAVCVDDLTPLPGFDWRAAAFSAIDDRPDGQRLEAAAERLQAQALAEATRALGPFRARVAQRSRRDVLRVDRYFQEMDEDLQRRVQRAQSGVRLAQKHASLPGERERRLATLRENYTIRATVHPLGLVLLRYPVATALLGVLRRKHRRDFVVRYDGVWKRWHPLVCSSCAATTYAFGACDDEVHVLCPRCLDQHDRRCPRCRGRTPAIVSEGLDLPARHEPVEVPAFMAGSSLTGRPERPPPSPPPGALPSRPAPARPADPQEARTPRSAVTELKRIAAAMRSDEARSGLHPDESREEEIVAALRRFREPVSSGTLQAAVGATAAELRPHLGRLVDRRLVERTGQRRGTRYRWLGDG